jgi:DNA repair photolyase
MILQPCNLGGYEYQIDPYIGCEHHCNYCYALNQAETDWTKETLIYPDFPSRLSEELDAIQPQRIYLGWNSDPYQPSESSIRHIRTALKILQRKGFSVCILTKSGLVIRDIDLFVQMPGSSVGFSVAFQDQNTRRLFEANAPDNAEKLQALERLKSEGIRTYTLFCPVMPFITHVETLIEMVAPYSDTIWLNALSMEKDTDRNWRFLQQILDQYFPGLTEQYLQIAFSTTNLYWSDLREWLERIRSSLQLAAACFTPSRSWWTRTFDCPLTNFLVHFKRWLWRIR